MSAAPESAPSLDEWLAMPRSEIAAVIAPRRLSMMYWIDGTRRHYLLSSPALDGKIADFDDYARRTSEAYVRVYDLLFELGVGSVMTTLLYPPNFQRGASYVKKAMALTEAMLLEEPFKSLYARWNTKVRLFGDYRTSPHAASARSTLERVQQALVQSTPTGSRALYFGYCAGSFNEEMLVRAATLQQSLGRTPTEEEVRAACYPDGPGNIDIFVTSGWLRVGLVLPPLLDAGKTDLYALSHLALDVHEESLRRILHDHLFSRWAGREDDAIYGPADVRALKRYYDTHQRCLVGTGHLVGPGIWHPDHDHHPRTSVPIPSIDRARALWHFIRTNKERIHEYVQRLRHA
ncbi:hypothetical protein LZC95_34260 [Pendulispora brunnea]|uniref:Uncharacterized protein n=1 Tax=Pendulispora brunnea TaxID=2905690 RepID=A0ABZ2K3Z1_9BACT